MSINKSNPFLLQQFVLTGAYTYSNWINAAQKCYREFERQIRAMFGDSTNNKHTYYNILNSNSHNKTTDCRCRDNGLAHVKFARYYQDLSTGMYTHEDYYFRCLFPKQNRISIKWREEFDNLQYFILFIDNYTIGYLDNTKQQVKQELIKKSNNKQITEHYITLNSDELQKLGICKIFTIDEDKTTGYIYTDDGYRYAFKHLIPKLSQRVFLQMDPRRSTSYVCYDGNSISNMSMKEIISYLGLKRTESVRCRIKEYIKNTSEALLEDKQIKAYNAITTGKNLLIFRKNLSVISSKQELENYLNTHQAHKYTQDEVKYRRNLMKKLSRCNTKADLTKKFTAEEITYMSFDQRYLSLLNNLK